MRIDIRQIVSVTLLFFGETLYSFNALDSAINKLVKLTDNESKILRINKLNLRPVGKTREKISIVLPSSIMEL